MRSRMFAALTVLGAAVGSVVTAGVTAAAAPAVCAPPVVSVAGAAHYEGSGGGTKLFTLTATMAPPAPGCPTTGSVHYLTVDGTAVAGQDYTAATSTLSWTAPGPQLIAVPVTRDDADEPDERFTVELTGARGVTIGDGRAAATIYDDDAGASQPGVVTSVPDSGICWWPGDKCAIPVRLNTIARAAVRVRLHTVDGTAVARKDYAPIEKEIVTIPAGADHVNVPVELLAGARPETYFGVELDDVDAGTVGVASTTITIREG